MSGVLSRFSKSTPDVSQILAQAVYNIHEPAVLGSKRRKSVRLEINGQGSCSFNIRKSVPRRSQSASELCGVVILKSTSHLNSELLRVHIYNSDIKISGADSFRFKAISKIDLSLLNLLYFNEPSRYLWVSIDKNNTCIKVGHGYLMESNTLIRFEPKNKSEKEHVRQLLEQIEKIQLSDMWELESSLKYWRLPVVRDPPYLIVSHKNTRLNMLDGGIFITSECLPPECNRLYSIVKGANLRLSSEEIRAINYSIKTKGCVLYQKLKEKGLLSNASVVKKTSYIRIGLGSNIGDSVGEPYVLELWPIGHESPIHSHGDAVAIIKVLHGSIEVSFYNPLVEENNEDLQPVNTVVLKEGDTTYITPEFYQTHKLRNIQRDTTAATIQCYGYLGNNITHHEHFDYVSEIDHRLHRFRPRSDFTFEELLSLVQTEYVQRPHTVTRRFAGLFCVSGVTSDL